MLRPLSVYAAGSLRNALPMILERFSQRFDIDTQLVLGPAGLLRQRIEVGETVDLFASANRAHPQRLFVRGLTGEPRRFSRNSLCIIMKNEAELTGRDWLEALMDERFILATSTPHSDPSGDYAVELFQRIDAIHPGCGRKLIARARHLVGGNFSSPIPKGQQPAPYLIRSGQADIFIGYGNNRRQLEQYDDVKIVTIPPPYQIEIEYCLCVMNSAPKLATMLADFILSDDGQRCLQQAGFKSLD
jgi:molybdate transport system substrate-binding protein